MDNIYTENDAASRKLRTQISYQSAIGQYRRLHRLARICWVTWLITIATAAAWCVTAY